VQGYIYFRPMSAEDATALVAGDLMAEADGPRSARPPRQNLLRRVAVVHNGNRLNATLRNISECGAMIEGLWNMPAGSALRIEFDAQMSVTSQIRWSRENRMGVEFHAPLERRSDNSFAVLRNRHPMAAAVGSLSSCAMGGLTPD
jgi:hypothetical protein